MQLTKRCKACNTPIFRTLDFCSQTCMEIFKADKFKMSPERHPENAGLSFIEYCKKHPNSCDRF